MTPYELQEAVLQAHRRFYSVRQMVALKYKAPMYRKHQVQGYLMTPGLGARAREPRFHAGAQGVLRDSQRRPCPPDSGFLQSGQETVTAG